MKRLLVFFLPLSAVGLLAPAAPAAEPAKPTRAEKA
jgi:hypothetical protein